MYPMSENGNSFPSGFRFGVATAAYQIEGAAHEDGRGESIWDRFCDTPGAVDGGDTGAVACDHYHRWREDLDLMQALGVDTYRFSISWPRVMPDGTGRVNGAGLGFYRRLAEGLRERGIEPMATLYHWDLPQALQDLGGWGERDTALRFAEYAELLATELGDVVTDWITHNEPWVVAFLGHAEGVKAPGIRDWPTALRVAHHLLLSHGLAAERLRSTRPGARVGIALNLAPIRAASSRDDDVAAARRMDGHLNRWFLDPLLEGSYPEDIVALFERRFGMLDFVRAGDFEVIGGALDFLGVNYYSPQRVADAPGRGPLELRHVNGDGARTAMGWEVDAHGLREVLSRLSNDYAAPPVYITENGAAFEDPLPDAAGNVADPRRTEYLRDHLEALRAEIANGARVERYYLWSLLDNFEWEHGYAKRFGVVYVDYETQHRLPKGSGLWYRDYIARMRNGGGP
jgi:beta-glucosidase